MNKKGIVLTSKLYNKKKKKAPRPHHHYLCFSLFRVLLVASKGVEKSVMRQFLMGRAFRNLFMKYTERKSELSSQQERLRKGFRWIKDTEKTLLMVLRMYVMYRRRGIKKQIVSISHNPLFRIFLQLSISEKSFSTVDGNF